MANSNFPRGLVPVRKFADGGYANPLRRYSCPATYATALYRGDPVIKTGTADAEGFSEVNLATAGGAITGVVVGFEDAASYLAGYGAASTTRAVLVADDPSELFEIQSNGTTVPADIGLNANLVAGAGNPNTRSSGWQLDDATKATTATLQLKIVEFQHRVDNDPAAANAKFLVKINKHTETAGQAGI
jgi:hypothetical protein